MLSYFDLRKGVDFILDGQPYEVLEFQPMRSAQGKAVVQTKIKNLINNKVIEINFHQEDKFEEADLEKFEVRFLYSNRGKFGFCEVKDQSKRFELTEEQIGSSTKFLKTNEILNGIRFQDKIINIIPPIKVQLKVKEAAPGTKGNRSQAGTKSVVLESGASLNVPLFVEQDDIIEINTETGEYVRRVE